MNASREARRALAVALAAMTLGVAACSKAPKVDKEAERAAALERSKKAAFGTQVNALETAKGIEADVNQKAQSSVDNIEKDAK